MKVIVVGGAGRVGRTVQPALDAVHEVTYFDLKPVPNAEKRTIIGNVNDDEAVRKALVGQEVLVYMPLGVGPTGDFRELDPCLDVNLKGFWRWSTIALKAGARRIVYASTQSVFNEGKHPYMDETIPTDGFSNYSMSKRLAEYVCAALAQQYADACVLALRIRHPHTVESWPGSEFKPGAEKNTFGIGPKDLGRLFVAAVALAKPGVHIVQTTGDIEGKSHPNARVQELIGWFPRNE